MNESRCLLLLAALAICAQPHPAACDPPTRTATPRESAERKQVPDADATDQPDTSGSADGERAPKYAQGDDPRKTDRDQAPTLPDDAWGEVAGGLQAAISAPDRIRRNEVVTAHDRCGYRFQPRPLGSGGRLDRPQVHSSRGRMDGLATAARRPIEVLEKKVPFEIGPLKDLPAGHGLPHVLGIPQSLNQGTTEWIQLRPDLDFALDWSQDAHWLLDGKTCNQLISWGPIPAARLKELKLLEPIRRASQETIQTSEHFSEVENRIDFLIRSQQPLTEMGLNFVLAMPQPQAEDFFLLDCLARTIRDRRVELENMGLAAPMQRALDVLTANDPPMPDDSQFKVISSTEIPPGLKEEAWGPRIAGLQAAALTPDLITAEATEIVRLFIRNVSDREVRLAVSQRAGYDYATAVDADGNQLTTVRPYIYPSAFSSVIAPELNPGQSAQQPPTATLQKILLKPGAVLELETKTALSFHRPERETGSFYAIPQDDGQPAVTHISAEPTAARVTWRLHTANGAAYSQDLKRRVWPAKGAWGGILTTAPAIVQLRL